jgi:hypothetical protein
MISSIKKDRFSQIAIVWFVLLTAWWLTLYLSGSQEGSRNLFFGAVYGTTMSLFGVIVGLSSAKLWGGWKSIMGKAIIVLSLGLFAQFFGQVVFSFYNIVLGVDIPYPSLADVGYFGNIPFYLFGIFLLGKASGVKIGLKSYGSQIQSIVIPLGMILLSYILFLREYSFADTGALTIFLDFAYPIGQALYVSVAILVFSLSRKVLGGIMRSKILLLLVAFVVQYVADFNFLYQNLTGTWYNGGYGDYLYLVAYLFMALGLFQLRAVALTLKTPNTKSKK